MPAPDITGTLLKFRILRDPDPQHCCEELRLTLFQVKRLLRADNEAVSVKWEVITEEELNANKVPSPTTITIIVN
jgi:hypothetical protein